MELQGRHKTAAELKAQCSATVLHGVCIFWGSREGGRDRPGRCGDFLPGETLTGRWMIGLL